MSNTASLTKDTGSLSWPGTEFKENISLTHGTIRETYPLGVSKPVTQGADFAIKVLKIDLKRNLAVVEVLDQPSVRRKTRSIKVAQELSAFGSRIGTLARVEKDHVEININTVFFQRAA